MNIKTLNARPHLLGPAPAGMKWIKTTEGNREYWHLECVAHQPRISRPWRKDPLEVTHSILPVEELRRETVDGIIADFIKSVSDEKTFRAYLRKAKKGLTEADYD